MARRMNDDRESDQSPLRINAYVLVADPSYLRESIQAYYPHVDRIVLSYDRNATSWTGTPLPIQQCLAIIAELDVDGKCEHHPGEFGRPGFTPMSNETHQRQHALDRASAGADWVLQLDTDEVMLNPSVFFAMLRTADREGAAALDFPARWLYSRTASGRYLEVTRRFWQVAGSFPGPLAVRAGVRLQHARQTDAATYRVDFAPRNTDPWRRPDAHVDAVISAADSVLHFSWVRDEEAIRRKFGWSGHTRHMRPPRVYRQWMWRRRHPLLTTLTTPLRRRDAGRYRLARIPEPPGGVPIALTFTPAELTP